MILTLLVDETKRKMRQMRLRVWGHSNGEYLYIALDRGLILK